MNSHHPEKAFLVGIWRSRADRFDQQYSLEELGRLSGTAGVRVIGQDFHELKFPSPATFLGKGKVERITAIIREEGIDVVIFDEILSPTQTRNLEKAWETKVLDRTGLILDIFAQRARTREGKLQVELAQLEYLLPRLVGRGREFSQLAGGIGTRGPGETRLELDRRKARVRLNLLKKDLSRVRTSRELHRKKRTEKPIAMVSLVGYTNAGKSTLMNRLTNADVLVEDKLFATLDPTVRRLKLPSSREILLSDTVGFIHKLPHQLITAFRATFEEVESADLLIHLIDVSHPNFDRQISTVEEVLRELELDQKPLLRVFNKIDRHDSSIHFRFEKSDLPVSALTGEGIPDLLQAIEDRLSRSCHHVFLLLPHEAGSELSLLYKTSRILKRTDLPEGIRLEAEVDEKHYNQFRRFHSDVP